MHWPERVHDGLLLAGHGLQEVDARDVLLEVHVALRAVAALDDREIVSVPERLAGEVPQRLRVCDLVRADDRAEDEDPVAPAPTFTSNLSCKNLEKTTCWEIVQAVLGPLLVLLKFFSG
jgi:hypothetical protein